MPLVRALTGPLYPNSHRRRYIQRVQGTTEGGADNANHPANVLIGTPADFEYDLLAELTFDDEAAFRAFFACISQEEAGERIAKDAAMVVDRAKMRVVLADGCIETTGPKSDR